MWEELLKAVAANNVNEVRRLLNLMSADDFTKDFSKLQHDQSPFHLAVYYKKEEIIGLFLAKNPSLANTVCDTSQTPLLVLLSNCATPGSNDIKIINMLLEKGANVNTRGNAGYTPLMQAITRKRLDLVELLLEKGALKKINKYCYSTYKKTALCFAAESGCVEIAKLLLEKQTDINYNSSYGTPLILAMQKGQSEMVRLLLARGADVNIVNDSYGSALHIAARQGNLAMFQLLLTKKPNIHQLGYQGETVLMAAVQAGALDLVKLILPLAKDDINKAKDTGETSLSLAANKEMMELLIQYGADVNHVPGNGQPLLISAVKAANLEVVELLLRKGALVNEENNTGETALGHASTMKMVNLLIQYGADINYISSKGNTALIGALQKYYQLKQQHGALGYKNKKEVVKSLLDKTIVLDQKNTSGQTALTIAATNGDLKLVNYLLEKGLAVDQEDIYGQTALFLAAQYGHSKIIELLLNKNANINHVTGNGQTALVAAIQNNHTEAVQLLLDYKAKINKVGQNNLTPLIAAISKSNMQIINALLQQGGISIDMISNNQTALCCAPSKTITELLLQNGANINYVATDGYTPLMYATTNGRAEVVEFLLSESKTNINSENQAGQTALGLVPNQKIAKILINHNAAVNHIAANGSTPLIFAVASGRVDVINILLDHGAKNVINHANKIGETALGLATNRIIAELLIKNGAQINYVAANEYTPLLTAVTKQNLEVVKLLLEQPDINVNCAIANTGQTPLMLAAASYNLNIIKMLLEKGAKVDTQNMSNQTAFALVPPHARNYSDILKLFLEYTNNINAVIANGQTPLMLAASKGYIKLIKYLLEREDIVVNQTAANGQTALSVTNDYAIAKKLIEKGATVNLLVDNITTPLMSAVTAGKTDLVKLLLDAGAVLNKQNVAGQTALCLAAQNGSIEIMQLLLKKIETLPAGKDAYIQHIAANGDTPLIIAARAGKCEIVELLLKEGAVIDKPNTTSNETALMIAVTNRKTDVITCLLEKGANIHHAATNGTTILMSAVTTGNLELVNYLLEKEVAIDQENTSGQTALCLAAQCGHSKIIESLLEKKANINHITGNGQTALMIATAAGRIDAVKCLLNNGANMHHVATNGTTVLMSAVASGDIELVNYLLEKELEVDQENTAGHTALCLAAQYGYSKIIESLLKKANINHVTGNGQTALMIAVANRKTDVITCLLEKGANIHHAATNGTTILMSAVTTGNLELVKFLLNKKVVVDQEDAAGQTALCLASSNLMANLLLEHGATVNHVAKNGNTSLISASGAGRFDIVKLLLERKAIVNHITANGQTALMSAAASGQIEVVKLLLASGAKDIINNENKNGQTALSLASSKEIAEFLIENEALVNYVAANGCTPLMTVAASGKIEVVKVLLQNKADVNYVANNGYTSLMRASTPEIAQLLLEQGAKVNHVATNGYTPLMQAAAANRMNVVQYLLKNGAIDSINKRDTFGQNSVFLAAQAGNAQLVKLLIDNGAAINQVANNGYTPLMQAQACERTPVVNLLLEQGATTTFCANASENPGIEVEDNINIESATEVITEYLPQIDSAAIKLFGSEEEELENDNDEIILQISNLIREGNDRLQGNEAKGILLQGNTGAGKSTLVYALGNRQLKASMDNETGELQLDAVNPIDGIKIGHEASETKIPNKLNIGEVTIWDCPGFNDTNIVQEIANSFYIKKLLEINKEVKFILVVPESHLTREGDRGNIFVETITRFMHSLDGVENISESISLIITHVSPHKNITHIQNMIKKVLINNNVAIEQSNLITNLINKSLHIFHKPIKEEIVAQIDLLTKIEEQTKYIKLQANVGRINISPEAKKYSKKLLITAGNKFDKILQLVVQAIADPAKCFNLNKQHNPLLNNYQLIQNLVPISIQNQINFADKTKHDFPYIDLLLELKNTLVTESSDTQDLIAILSQALKVLIAYAPTDALELKRTIQAYAYTLLQQYEYIKYFSMACEENLADVSNLASIVELCHANVSKNLEYQINILPLAQDKLNPDYYHQAIEYLANYNSTPCLALKAQAYKCLAALIEPTDKTTAINYYIQAIQANKKLPEIYENLGNLFDQSAKYAQAIECYKVINNGFKIKLCFKHWLNKDSTNPNIMLKKAEYLKTIGLFDKAKACYHYVYSLSTNQEMKAYAWGKIGALLINSSNQGHKFIAKANTHNFFNYEMVTEEFIQNLMLDEIKVKPVSAKNIFNLFTSSYAKQANSSQKPSAILSGNSEYNDLLNEIKKMESNGDVYKLPNDVFISSDELRYTITGLDNYYTTDFINMLLYPLNTHAVKVYPGIIVEKLEEYYKEIQEQAQSYAFIPFNVAYDDKEPQHKNHWVALIIDKAHGLVFYLDPAKKTSDKIAEQVTSLLDNLNYTNAIILNPIDFQQAEKAEGWIRHCGAYVIEIFNKFANTKQCISGSVLADPKFINSLSVQTLLSDIPCGAAENINNIRRQHIKAVYEIILALKETAVKEQVEKKGASILL